MNKSYKRELEVEKTAFNDRLNRMIAKITQIQKSLKNEDFGNL